MGAYMSYSILIVDDHALFRTGLQMILRNSSNFKIVGEAETGEEALAFLENNQVDVVLMDVNMPGMGGIEATRRINALPNAPKVIAVTAMIETPFPNKLLDVGARGYVSKGCSADELNAAISAAANNELFLSGDVAQSLALGKLRDPKNTGDIEGVKKLSAREFQCMMMIVNGQGTQEISEVLELSPKTVSTYRHRLYEKIGVANDVELTHFAIRNALVSV
jgi:two-component system invasion response regulator UvrY